MSIPPRHRQVLDMVGVATGGVSITAVLVWVLVLLLELKTGMARLDERMKAIEERLPASPIAARLVDGR